MQGACGARERSAVNITIDGLAALRLIRAVRAQRIEDLGPEVLSLRTGLSAPVFAEGKRWSAKRLSATLARFGGLCPFPTKRPLDIAVPAKDKRLRISGIKSRVYGHPLPKNAFVDLGCGVSVAGPELLFVEMGAFMQPAVQLMLGLELCGRFSRDPMDPRDGEVSFNIEPATTPEAILSYVGACRGMAGLRQTRELAPLVCAGAWSPTESLIAALALLPYHHLGYNMAPLTLNPRVRVSDPCMDAGSSAVPVDIHTNATHSRVPDILFGKTSVGLNYDGGVYLELEQIAHVAAEASLATAETPSAHGVGRSTDDPRTSDTVVASQAVQAAIRQVRDKYVDDRRRDRDLWSQGLAVLPVTREDLYQKGGLDTLMMRIIDTIEHLAKRKDTARFEVPASPALARMRQRLIWMLLPGARGRQLAREYERYMSTPHGHIEEVTIVFV